MFFALISRQVFIEKKKIVKNVELAKSNKRLYDLKKKRMLTFGFNNNKSQWYQINWDQYFYWSYDI